MSEYHSIYIHIPFCVKKCWYCDFYSVADLSLTSDYVRAVVSEIRMRAEKTHPVQSVYFGGGTPSVLNIKEIHSLISALDRYHLLLPEAEITMEVNPGTIDRDYLDALRLEGINRLSVGVQSFDDGKLKFLKRIHSGKQAAKTLDNAMKSGFDNIGLDLMYGIPGETPWSWQQDLDRAVGYRLPHLSCYMLTIEPDTPLFKAKSKNRYTFPDPGELSAMFASTSLFLQDNGYMHYEISNFAKGPDYRSIHNGAYWDRSPYMGFGAAAHSFDGRERSWNHADVHRYVSDVENGLAPVAQSETLTTEQHLLEIIMLGLRTSKGIDIRQYDTLSDPPFSVCFKELIQQIEQNHWGRYTPEAMILTLEGRTFMNHITRLFANTL